MKKVDKENYHEIDGGGFLAGATAVAGIAQSFATITKMFSSDSGTIKLNKDQSFTWKDSNEDVNILLPKMHDA